MMIFLWRIAGKPKVEGEMPFKDIDYKASTDTYQAILWGSQKEIIEGYGDGTFRPENPVTRKDTMIMIYRMAGEPEVTGQNTLTDVLDKGYEEESDTYRAILWGTTKAITKGYDDGTFRPDVKCLREHIVTFLYRYASL